MLCTTRHGATLRTIADRLGASPGTLYHVLNDPRERHAGRFLRLGIQEGRGRPAILWGVNGIHNHLVPTGVNDPPLRERVLNSLLAEYPYGLTIEELVNLSGLSRATVYRTLRSIGTISLPTGGWDTRKRKHRLPRD
jgi:hypothetical protein